MFEAVEKAEDVGVLRVFEGRMVTDPGVGG
jgi:hypothetical protein